MSDEPNEPAEPTPAGPAVAPAPEEPTEASGTQPANDPTPAGPEVAPAPDEPTEAVPRETPASTTAHDAEQKPADQKLKSRSRNLSLIRAYRTSRPVEGKIVEIIKGGYEVKIGKARGFCPHSQMQLQREDQPERHLGLTYQFRVIQLRRGGEDAVLSRRALLEEERAEEAKAVRATLVEGQVMQGRVAGTADFGAFVDLGAGVMGLVHISELSHARVARVEDSVKPGDVVRVKILKTDDAKGRVSLSMRQAREDPWQRVDERYLPGQVHPGTVLRITDFGAFVELEPGLEALAPATEFPPTVGGFKEGLEPGARRDWYVVSVDAKQRRIAVTLPGEGGAEAVTAGVTLKGRVQRVEKFGLLVWLGPGKIGLVPRALTGLDPREDLARRFPIASEIEVDVLEVSEAGRRIRLAKKGVEPQPAETKQRAPEPQKPRAPQPPARSRESAPASNQAAAFGTSLADKLRAALDRKS